MNRFEAKVAVHEALLRHRLRLLEGKQLVRSIAAGTLMLFGEILPVITEADRTWLSAKLRDIAGDIDDRLWPGGIRRPFDVIWTSTVMVGDRVIDDEDAREAWMAVLQLPPPSPDQVLVRRWRASS